MVSSYRAHARAPMSDDAKATTQRLADVGKLVQQLREVQAKEYAITEEIQRILGGGARQADLLKAAERTFDTLWGARYAGGATGRYVWAYMKDRPQMVRLIKMLGLEEVEARMRRYLASHDPFFAKGRHSFGLFVSTINQHAREAAPADDFELDAGTVVDCHHQPVCTSDAEHTRRRREELTT